MKLGLSDLAIAITSIIVLVSIVLTFQTEIVWVAQDFAAIPSLFFLLAVILIGVRLSGRTRGKPKFMTSNLLGTHKKLGIFFAILVITTFFIGFWGQIFHGELFFWEEMELSVVVIHGWFGFFITILALLQVFPSIVIKDRRKIRKAHLVLGFLILTVLLVQIFLGIWAVLDLTGE